MKKSLLGGDTPLSVLVRKRLAELDLRQSDFCRLTGFDQGLLSKIQSSIVTSLSLESALRLAIGLGLSPVTILRLIERMDLHELIIKSYAPEEFGLDRPEGSQIPEPVLEISRMALRAYLMDQNLTPVRRALYPLAAMASRAATTVPDAESLERHRELSQKVPRY